MNRPLKLAAITALTVSMTALSSMPAEACNGGSRRAFRPHVPFATSHRTYQPRYHQAKYQKSRHHASPVYRHAQPVIVHPQPVVRTQPVVQQQQVVQSQAIAPAPARTVTAQTQPSQQAAPVQQTSAPQTSTTQMTSTLPATQPAGSEATALQLLESLSDEANTDQSGEQIPEFSASTPNTAGDHVGTWKVNLPGNQSVELILNENGTFRWTATKNGNRSAFEGQYRLETGRLTLVRSTDLQQMAGSWTADGEKFTFKLDGTKTGGLAFARS